MTLISSSIPNFVNGVSQQPFTLRLSSQGEVQENGLSTVSAGLRKRPPTEHLAKVGSTPVTDAFVHQIDRDGLEQYQVIVTQGSLKVYSLDGVAKTVNISNAPYLNTAKAVDQSFAMTTVADYTFVVNKTVVTKQAAGTAPPRPHEALINVKAGNYGKTYSVTINGVVEAAFTTPDGTSAAGGSSTFVEIMGPPLDDFGNGTTPTGTYTKVTDGTKMVEQIGTDYIAKLVYNQLVAKGYNAGLWQITRNGSVIHLRNATADFTITCEDGFGNNAMVVVKDTLQKFSDLPANPRVDGFTVEIIGDQASDFDNYWVRFDANGSNGNTGVWRETIKPGTPIGLDPLTMPHLLIREANGTFTFKPAEWKERKVGDIDSNPNPSFVDRTINDVFFFQNRLGFLSDENYVQSETGTYFNVFRTTVTTLLDSDPVDVNAATNKVAVLQHAVGFNKQLLLFSGQQQFVVDDVELMTPKRVPIKPTTDFSVNVLAKPVAAGRNVYFTTDKGAWSAVREFFAESNSNTNDAADVTSHVPRYIPSGVRRIASGASEDVLVLLSATDRSRLFVYKYYFSGTEKLQSSWSLFSFSSTGNILDCGFVGSTLYLVVSRPDGLYFEKMDFALGGVDLGEPYQVMLDRKVQVSTSALSFDGTHTLIHKASIGYTPGEGTYTVVTKGGGAVKSGIIRDVTFVDPHVRILGNYTASPLAFGQRYMWRYQLSVLTVKLPAQGGGFRSDIEARTQVRRIAFSHADTGYYKVKVTPLARQTYEYVFAGKVLGSPSAEIGKVSLPTGRHVVPVMCQNTSASIVVESDMPLPAAILSADWEAFYVKRSRSR